MLRALWRPLPRNCALWMAARLSVVDLSLCDCDLLALVGYRLVDGRCGVHVPTCPGRVLISFSMHAMPMALCCIATPVTAKRNGQVRWTVPLALPARARATRRSSEAATRTEVPEAGAHNLTRRQGFQGHEPEHSSRPLASQAAHRPARGSSALCTDTTCTCGSARVTR